MILPTFDQTRESEKSAYGEAVRLSNEIRARAASLSIDPLGNRIDTPSRVGFNVEDCEFLDLVNWLADTRIKKSESSRAFAHRILSVRFPTEYAQNKTNIENRYKLEVEMIESNSKNEVEWFGQVGYQNRVRLDNSLTNTHINSVKLRNGNVISRKK